MTSKSIREFKISRYNANVRKKSDMKIKSKINMVGENQIDSAATARQPGPSILKIQPKNVKIIDNRHKKFETLASFKNEKVTIEPDRSDSVYKSGTDPI